MKALPASEWWLRGLQSYGKERQRMREGRLEKQHQESLHF